MSTTRIRLSKLHGAGNDFLVTAAPDGSAPGADIAARLCDRHLGVGADGLITLLPGRDGADCTMELRNADGTVAEMSGNGIACLSWVAVRDGLGDGKRLVVDTGSGRREVELDIDAASGQLAGATVDMGPVCASAAVAHRRGLVGDHVTVRVRGGSHEVELGETIRLHGPVTHVFDAEVDVA